MPNNVNEPSALSPVSWNPQVEVTVRSALLIAGTLVSVLGIATPDQWGKVSAQIMQIAGPAATLVGLVWGWWVNRQSAILTTVAVNMGTAAGGPVEHVVLDPRNRDSFELNKATPKEVVVGPPGGVPAAAKPKS